MSVDFFNEVGTRPVPVDVKALRALRGSPLRLDLCQHRRAGNHLCPPTEPTSTRSTNEIKDHLSLA